MSTNIRDVGRAERLHWKRTLTKWVSSFIIRVGLKNTRLTRSIPSRVEPDVAPAGVATVGYVLTKREYFDVFRAYRIREHDLLNQRLTWNLTIQGFLFVTYGYCVQKLAEIQVGENGVHLDLVEKSHAMIQLREMVRVVPPVGLLLSIVLGFAVLSAYAALKRLRKDWNEKLEHLEPYLPNPAGADVAALTRFGIITPISIPIIFTGAWLAILLWR